jgi:hypothetical protein
MKLGTYIMATEPNSGAYFTNPSHQSVSVRLSPAPIFARQRLGKVLSLHSVLGSGSVNTFPRQQIHTTIKEMLDASFSMWSVFYQRTVCGSVYPPLLLRNNSVKTFPQQRRIVGGIVFYEVRDVSKESRRSVLSRICYLRESSPSSEHNPTRDATPVSLYSDRRGPADDSN